MDELIKREDAIEAMAELQGIAQSKAELTGISKAWKRIKVLPTVDAVPVDFINQKIVELQSCAYQHFNDGNEILATCVLETIRLLGSFLKEWRGKDGAE